MMDAIKEFFGIPTKKKKMEPEGYVIQASEWPEGVGKRITESVSSTAQKGVSGVEITAEHPESITPTAVEEIKTFNEQEDVIVNLHATMQLRTAMAERKNYDRVDKYMEGYIKKAGEIGADYVNLHTSMFPSPELGRVRGVRHEVMVSPEGESVVDYVQDIVENHYESETLDWLIRDLRKKLRGVIDRWWLEEVIMDEDNQKKYFEEIVPEEEVQNAMDKLEEEKRNAEMMNRETDYPEPTRARAWERVREWYEGRAKSIIMEFRDADEDLKTEVAKEAFKRMLDEKELDLERIFNEFRMYQLVGWRMYEKGHPIWKKICGGRSPDELEEDNKMKLLVDAVAGRYIEGHVKKWKDDLEEKDVVVTLETPDAREKDFLGHYRLVKPSRIYKVIKAIDHPHVKLCFDFEHIATHGFDVKNLLDEAPDKLGEETFLVHLSSSPSPGHQHHPLQKGEIELYKMLWRLKNKGFESGYLTFERGGGGSGGGGQEDEIWKESIPIAKEMAMYLEDDVPPEELPEEFYGYDEKEFKRDEAIVKSNTFEPMKGLIESPELRDTFLGSHAIREKRMQPEEWKKEEHR